MIRLFMMDRLWRRRILTNVCVVVNWTFHLQQCQIVFECGRIVLAVHDNAFDVLCD